MIGRLFLPKEWRSGPSLRLISFLFLLISTKLLAVVGAEGDEVTSDVVLALDEDRPNQSNAGITLDEFQGLLFTHVNNEVSAVDDETGSINRVAGADITWSRLVQHGWDMATSTTSKDDDIVVDEVAERSSAQTAAAEEKQSSFLVCARGGNMSGYERLQPVLKGFGVDISATMVVSNLPDETCRFVTTAASKAQSLAGKVVDGLTFAIIPVFDMMKISLGTIDEVSSERWAIPPSSSNNNRALAVLSNGTWQDDDSNDWDRSIMVGLAPGVGGKSDLECETIAGAIIADIKVMAEEGFRRRRRQLQGVSSSTTSSVNLRGGNKQTPTSGLSVSDAFSATSARFDNPNRRHLLDSTSNVWSRALERGLESHHMCASMFDDIDIRLRHGNKGFEYILNPMNAISADDESSASNTDCVISFIAALSTHPYVVTVESNGEVTSDSNTNAQWITQTSEEGHTPFFGAGITGKGEIVSISDSGVDLRSCWFKDERGSGNIFNGRWDFSRRKVVSYDNTFRDAVDEVEGHGSHVAGTMVGDRPDGKADEGQGIAPDAKLHVFDMKHVNGGMSDPGAKRLFASIYNNGNGAKVHNGSWGRSGRPYSSHCQDWDGSLSGEYEDLLYVVSAGNTGGGARTVKNPADCKNTFTVGCSQSIGGDLSNKKDMGLEYMTSWSSRGPTYDGRTKPDIVAPGYNIHSANGSVGKDTCKTVAMAGTSMSAPVVAGNAALVRQYFRDGFYPCGVKGCGESITPSGSLVKAVLVNGAQNLKGVQFVPGGSVRTISEYDNTQNMGVVRLNRSMPLQGENSINTYIVNNKEIAVGQTDFVDIEINTNGRSVNEISVALVWYDPPTAAYCSNCIRNNLDLKVEKTRGESVLSTFYPNGLSRPDIKNTVERIRLSRVSHGDTYRISVRAANFDDASQKYSLALTGSFDLAAVGPIETPDPTASPTALPTPRPSDAPTASPSLSPSKLPTPLPTITHSSDPSASPSKSPTPKPSAFPTMSPITSSPSTEPSNVPSDTPSSTSSSIPSLVPTDEPTGAPHPLPSSSPSDFRSGAPTEVPSSEPGSSPLSSLDPTNGSTPSPTSSPESQGPTSTPSVATTTLSPVTTAPATDPPTTKVPSLSPVSESPTPSPSLSPVTNPPTRSPSSSPVSESPTPSPSLSPVTNPPTRSPSSSPVSSNPTPGPTKTPVQLPANGGIETRTEGGDEAGENNSDDQGQVETRTEGEDEAGENKSDDQGQVEECDKDCEKAREEDEKAKEKAEKEAAKAAEEAAKEAAKAAEEAAKEAAKAAKEAAKAAKNGREG